MALHWNWITDTRRDLVDYPLSVRSKVSRFFSRRFDAQRAEQEGAYSYLTKLGTLEDRILAIREMNIDETMAEKVDEFINWSAQTWEAAIPYLTAKDDYHLLKKVRAYLDNHGLFLRFKQRLGLAIRDRDVVLKLVGAHMVFDPDIVHKIPPGAQYVESETKTPENETPEDEEGEEGEEEGDYYDEDEEFVRIRMIERVIPPQLAVRLNTSLIVELEDTVRQCRVDMLQDSKLVIALSFGKADVEAAKTIVISKPEIIPRLQRPASTTSSSGFDSLIAELTELTEVAQRRQRLDQG